MKFRYSQSDFGLGLRARQEKERAPFINGTLSGATNRPFVSNLELAQEKRGGKFAGERLSAFLHQPGEMERTQGWMNAFERGNLPANMNIKRNKMETAQMFNPEPPMNEEEMA
jgi:hypothetical protein